jgi:hypothetical protein
MNRNYTRKQRPRLLAFIGVGVSLALVLLAGTAFAISKLQPSHAASANTATKTPVALTATYKLNTQWPGGFNVTLKVANPSQTPTRTWQLQFTFGGDQVIPANSSWEGKFTQAGNKVTITNDDENGTIDPGEDVTLGFNGKWTKNNTSPTKITAVGTPANTVKTVTGTNGTLTATYQLNSQWDTGLNVTLTIKNTSQTDINGWTLKFAFGGDQVIPKNSSWGGVFSQSGNQVTILNEDDNAAIEAGESVTLGFNATWAKDDTSPAALTVSGTPAK